MKLLSITIKSLFLLLILVSCKVADQGDQIVINELILLDNEDGISIQKFKERYLINPSQQVSERNRVYDETLESFEFDDTSNPVKLATIVSYFVRTDDVEYEQMVIKDGYPAGAYTSGIYLEDEQKALKTIEFKKENISGTYSIRNASDSLLYATNFSKGTGYWKDFYLNENTLREEGAVKNNFKSGVWKYYNHSGGMDSTKTYTPNDKIDVRFPYCLLQ